MLLQLLMQKISNRDSQTMTALQTLRFSNILMCKRTLEFDEEYDMVSNIKINQRITKKYAIYSQNLSEKFLRHAEMK